MWDYGLLFNEIDCPTVNQIKRNKGSSERYKKRFCLRCMVSFSNESLHICQGMYDKCSEKVEDHLDCEYYECEYYECELHCCICERYFTNEFCFESHKMNKLTGEFGSYCQFLAGLKNCDLCTRDFELTLKCKHFGKSNKATRNRSKDVEEVLSGSNFSGVSQQKYVKCGICSGFYLKGSISHSCFLRKSDSIFANPAHRSSTIKSHNVFYYHMESRLENYYECKVEKPEVIDENGRVIFEKKQMRKTFFAADECQVNDFRLSLSDEESDFFVVSKCQSHQPTLLCVVNESHSVKSDFCESDLGGKHLIMSFFRWMVDDVVKPTYSSKNEKNDYVFVAHNGSAYDAQFIYKTADEFLGYINVNVLLHIN